MIPFVFQTHVSHCLQMMFGLVYSLLISSCFKLPGILRDLSTHSLLNKQCFFLKHCDSFFLNLYHFFPLHIICFVLSLFKRLRYHGHRINCIFKVYSLISLDMDIPSPQSKTVSIAFPLISSLWHFVIPSSYSSPAPSPSQHRSAFSHCELVFIF